MAARSTPPRWKCPKCGREFRARGQWHSCGEFTLAGYLRNKGPAARRLFDGFAAAVAGCGPCQVAPTKTQVSFRRRRNFAVVMALSNRTLKAALLLPRRISSKRISLTRQVSPWVYYSELRIESALEIDDELVGWLREAYEMAADENG
jgi:hypothetical protein